ncbi:hypothetical protein Scep_019586 [Stephania cephalantha]|uniref:Uncharacterized protein n=1 Tax=Stephania cephalantha TaxID=152367 RepID=A0AAP0IBL0_9MAGN
MPSARHDLARAKESVKKFSNVTCCLAGLVIGVGKNGVEIKVEGGDVAIGDRGSGSGDGVTLFFEGKIVIKRFHVNKAARVEQAESEEDGSTKEREKEASLWCFSKTRGTRGVGRAWLGDSNYAAFAAFPASQLSWDAFMGTDDSKSRARFSSSLGFELALRQGRLGGWFFDRVGVSAIDCPYPCDNTCHNLVSK